LELQTGDVLFDRYEIQRFLGQGGWGRVYVAFDRELERPVAIKHLKPEVAQDPKAVGRFRKESPIMAQLSQLARVVTIYDFISKPETNDYFSIMEYVEGGSLGKYSMERGVVDIAEALNIVIDICRTLEAVHKKGIVHRDLKPGNILLAREDDSITAKLSDFGVALWTKEKPPTDGTPPTGPAGVSFAYASPEQLLEEKSDHRSDLYSLGVILYELLVGHRPFHTDDEWFKALSVPITVSPPSQARPGISKPLDETVLRALERNPDDRYSNAWQMANALKEALRRQKEWEDALAGQYQEAKKLFDEEKWPQAVSALQDIVAQHSEYKDAPGMLTEAQRQMELSAAHERWKKHRAHQEWEKTLEALQKIKELAPEDPHVGDRIKEAEDQIELKKLDAQATECEEDENWSEAIGLLLAMLRIAPGDYTISKRLNKAQQQQQQFQEHYEKAEKAIENEQWTVARKELEAIDADPPYKDVPELLARAKERGRLEQLYKQGMKHFQAKEWERAIESFEQVVAIEPAYSEAAINLFKARNEHLEQLYEQGIQCYEAREWERAIKSFEQATGIRPEYRDVRDRLADARKQQRVHRILARVNEHCDKKEWTKAQEAIGQLKKLYGYQELVEEESLHLVETYSQGMRHFGRGEWPQAIQQFQSVLDMDLAYKDAAQKLAEAKVNNLLKWRYRLIKEIGYGLLSRVWLAEDLISNKHVALKVLNSSLTDHSEFAEFVKRFQREAEVAKSLSDAHIAQVRGYEEYSDAHVIVMEYVEGVDLLELIRRHKKLSVTRSLDIAQQVCQALISMHASGIVHRDIKPQNIIVGEDGQVKVTDLGLAKAAGHLTISYPDQPIGTPHFMAPEQERCETDIDGRADIYALGMTLLVMMTGYSGLENIQSETVEAWQSRGIPKPIGEVIAKATAKERNDRYPRAEDMLSALVEAKRRIPVGRRLRETLWERVSEAVAKATAWEKIITLILSAMGVIFTCLACIFSTQWHTISSLIAPEKTALITNTPTATVTHTPPITATITPASTLTRTPTATPSPAITPTLPTATPKAAPTSTPRPTSTPYPAPVLISPDESASFTQVEDVKLVWEWERVLAGNELFEVRVRLRGQQEFDPIAKTQYLYYFVSASELTQSGTYEWQVAIVLLSGEERGASQTWSFEVR